MGAVNIRVPATSANLGPGFDSIGLAIPSLYDELEVSWGKDADLDNPVKVVPGGLYQEFGDEVPEDKSNMVYKLISQELGKIEGFVGHDSEFGAFSIVARNNIPHSRGLGSSSAAIVSALRAVQAITGESLLPDDDAIFRRANELEGHPDNVAPCVFGGVQLANPGGQSVTELSAKNLHIELQVYAHSGLATKSARSVLPESIPYAEAVANTRNFGNLVAQLSNPNLGPDVNSLLFDSTHDYLHQEYRRELYPESMVRVDTLRANTIPAMISGAGTTVIAFWNTTGENAQGLKNTYAELFKASDNDGWKYIQADL